MHSSRFMNTDECYPRKTSARGLQIISWLDTVGTCLRKCEDYGMSRLQRQGKGTRGEYTPRGWRHTCHACRVVLNLTPRETKGDLV